MRVVAATKVAISAFQFIMRAFPCGTASYQNAYRLDRMDRSAH
jgi:hypothetical protein